MKLAEVKVGEKYQAKVSAKLVTVEVVKKIDHNGRKGFEVKNLVTGRTIELRGAGRLRPLPIPLHFYIDANGVTTEIPHAEAVDTITQCFGEGKWLQYLREARTADGLLIPGIGRFRARTTA